MTVVVTVERVDAAVVASPDGEVDALSGSVLRRELIDVLDQRPQVLVLNLAKTSFLDSTGLGVLVAIARRARLIGCTFCLADPSPIVARVLHTTSLDRAWPVYPTIRAAVDDQAPKSDRIDS